MRSSGNGVDANLDELIRNSAGAHYQIAEILAFRRQTDRAFEFLD
jgi:hypothetical protein